MFVHVLSNPIAVNNFRKIAATDIVIVSSPFLGEMYQIKFGVKPIVAKKTLGAAVYLFFMILSKINKSTKFIIYHEANNYYFDLFWVIFRAKVKRIDYYSLDTFERSTFEKMPGSKYKGLLKFLGLKQKFDFYFSVDDFGHERTAWYRVKEDMCLSSSRAVRPTVEKNAPRNKVLIVTGTDVVNDQVLKSVIASITHLLTDEGYLWSIKDHPNPAFRLWGDQIPFDINAANFINPLRPSEEFISDFHYAIGFGSTGILDFGEPICVYNLISKSADVTERMRYMLDQASQQNKHVSLPKNIKELQTILS